MRGRSGRRKDSSVYEWMVCISERWSYIVGLLRKETDYDDR